MRGWTPLLAAAVVFLPVDAAAAPETLVGEEDSSIVGVIRWVFSDAHDSLLVPLPLIDGA